MQSSGYGISSEQPWRRTFSWQQGTSGKPSKLSTVGMYNVAEIRISISKFIIMVLSRKPIDYPLQIESLPQVKEFKYPGVLFKSERLSGKLEQQGW